MIKIAIYFVLPLVLAVSMLLGMAHFVSAPCPTPGMIVCEGER